VTHDCAALHASAHRSGQRSPGARRGTAGGGATVVEVEQAEALEHPRWRGHPPGKRVEKAAHQSFLTTGRVEKPGRQRRSPMWWVLRWPAGSVEGFAKVEAAGQWRWHARTEARHSDSDVVGFGHRRRRGLDGRARDEARAASAARRRLRTRSGRKRPVRMAFSVCFTRARRGVTLPLTVGPTRQRFSVLKTTPRRK
jgi:hypothetical protein